MYGIYKFILFATNALLSHNIGLALVWCSIWFARFIAIFEWLLWIIGYLTLLVIVEVAAKLHKLTKLQVHLFLLSFLPFSGGGSWWQTSETPAVWHSRPGVFLIYVVHACCFGFGWLIDIVTTVHALSRPKVCPRCNVNAWHSLFIKTAQCWLHCMSSAVLQTLKGGWHRAGM